MFEYMQRICCFMILAEMLLHLRPAKQYEKYLKMITGFISLAIVLLPACKFITTIGNSGQLATLEEFEKEMYEVMKEGEKMMQKEPALQSVIANEDETLDETGKKALLERIDGAVVQKGYQTKEISIKDESLHIILRKRTGGEVGKIQIHLSKNEEKSLREEIAKELCTDESNITISVE